MKDNFTTIAIVLDRSTSMAKLSPETIEGFNMFLNEQRKVDGEVAITLATFASDYSLVHDFVPLKSVPNLSTINYRCCGNTALLESIGKTINSLGVKLAALPEQERPSKVILAIITDGEENCSKEFSLQQIKEMVDHQTTKYSWVFVFLGSDLSTMKSGQSIGVSTSNTRRFAATKGGIGAVYSSLSANTTSYRSASAADIGDAGSFDFFKKDIDGLTTDKGSK